MPLTFHPRPGTLLICDFRGFKPPEMVKLRPSVVVSRSSGGVILVVPLSTVEPVPLQPCHVEMSADSLPKSLQAKRCWAKCDMITCVALRRLDRIYSGKCPKTGKRLYISPQISSIDFGLIQAALKHVLQL